MVSRNDNLSIPHTLVRILRASIVRLGFHCDNNYIVGQNKMVAHILNYSATSITWDVASVTTLTREWGTDPKSAQIFQQVSLRCM